MGNKTSILHILYALFPLNYERYIEPFGGSGAVLLGKKKPDKFEVYNDFNHNLVNLFRCMRDRPMAFIKELGFYPLNSRDDFNAIRDFFRQEKFDDKYLDEELELTKIILPDLKAEEISQASRPEFQSSCPKAGFHISRAGILRRALRLVWKRSQEPSEPPPSP